MMNRRKKGEVGERAAVEFLKKKGYRIIKQNYRYERGEIDIIAYDGEALVFIEVKARRSREFGEPIDAVTESKQRQIRKVADGYIAEYDIDDTACRFDVIAIVFKNGKAEIDHYEDAF